MSSPARPTLEQQRQEHGQNLVYQEIIALRSFMISHPEVTDDQLWKMAGWIAERALPLSQKTLVQAWQAVK